MRTMLARSLTAATRRRRGPGSTLVLAAALVAAPALLAPASEPTAPAPPPKEWIIAPRFLKLQQGVSREDARQWLIDEHLPLYRHYPGFNALLGDPLRSGGWGTADDKVRLKGDFVLVYIFDTAATRDRYFPPDGGWSEEVRRVVSQHQSTVDKLFGKYFVKGAYQMEEYLMYASAK